MPARARSARSPRKRHHHRGAGHAGQAASRCSRPSSTSRPASAATACPASSCRPRRCSTAIPSPAAAEIVAALDKHLCRCGAHQRILRAVERAAATLRKGGRHERAPRCPPAWSRTRGSTAGSASSPTARCASPPARSRSARASSPPSARSPPRSSTCRSTASSCCRATPTDGPDEIYTTSSLSIEVSGGSVRLVCAEVRAKALERAALRLNCSRDDLTVVDGQFLQNGARDRPGLLDRRGRDRSHARRSPAPRR